MANTHVKLSNDLRLMSRLDLCNDTAQRFLGIAKRHGSSWRWLNDKMEMMINNKFIGDMHLIVKHNGEHIGGVSVTCDWKKHGALKISLGDDVDVSGLGDGQTFSSIEMTLDMLEKYLDRLKSEYPGCKAEIWFGYDAAAIEKYGMDEIRRIVQDERSAEHIKNCAKEWAVISDIKRDSSQFSQELENNEELSVGAWGVKKAKSGEGLFSRVTQMFKSDDN